MGDLTKKQIYQKEKFFDSKEVAQAKYDAIRKKRNEYQKQYRLKNRDAINERKRLNRL